MNIRGLSGNVKKKCISNLVKKKEMCIECLQETKCEPISKEKCYQLWDSNDIDWIENGAVNNG